MIFSLPSVVSTLHLPTIHLGYEPATKIKGAVSSIVRGTTGTEPERDSHFTIARAKYTTETTPQSIPSPSTSGDCSKPGPITMHPNDLVHKDLLAAFHLQKDQRDTDGGCLMLGEQCKQVETEVLERGEDELGVLLISGSDDSGSDSGSEDSPTDLEGQGSESDSDYSPLPELSAPGDEEPDYSGIGPMCMLFQQAKTDYLLDFERRKYKAEKHTRIQHHSITYSRTRALVFASDVYRSRSSERSVDENGPQETRSKDREIFMRAWRKNQGRMSKASGRFWGLFDNEEEAAYEADDDLEPHVNELGG